MTKGEDFHPNKYIYLVKSCFIFLQKRVENKHDYAFIYKNNIDR